MKRFIVLLTLTITIIGCNENRSKSLSQLKQGKQYFLNEKYDSSIISLNRAIQLDSLNSEAFYYLSKNNYAIENYADGLKYLKLAESQKFNSDSIDELKLDILFATEKFDEYIKYCDKMISRNSSNSKIYRYKANAMFNIALDAKTDDMREEILKDALKSLNIALRLKEHDYHAICSRGSISIFLDDYKGAIRDFDTVIRNEKIDSSIISKAYRYKGITEKLLKNLTYAESLLDSAILYDKSISVLYLNRGDIRLLLKKSALACEDYRKALEFGDERAIDIIREKCN
jgi:tetratricopeptide (TPR) repeat protein